MILVMVHGGPGQSNGCIGAVFWRQHAQDLLMVWIWDVRGRKQ